MALAMLVAAFRRFDEGPAPIPTPLPGPKGGITAAIGVVATAGLGLMIIGDFTPSAGRSASHSCRSRSAASGSLPSVSSG